MEMTARVGLYLYINTENLTVKRVRYQCTNTECNHAPRTASKFCPECGSKVGEITDRVKPDGVYPEDILPEHMQEVVSGHEMIMGPIWLVEIPLNNEDGSDMFPSLHDSSTCVDCPITPANVIKAQQVGASDPKLLEVLNFLNNECGPGTAQLRFGVVAYWC